MPKNPRLLEGADFKRIVKGVSNALQKKVIVCKCGDIADQWCLECFEYMCGACANMHHAVPPTSPNPQTAEIQRHVAAEAQRKARAEKELADLLAKHQREADDALQQHAKNLQQIQKKED